MWGVATYYDGIYGNWLKPLLKSYFHMTLVQIPYRKPWYNGIVERFHRSLKTEAFPKIVPYCLTHVQDICWKYRDYFNHYRCHQGLEGKISNPIQNKLKKISGYHKIEHLGGLITSYESVFSNVA